VTRGTYAQSDGRWEGIDKILNSGMVIHQELRNIKATISIKAPSHPKLSAEFTKCLKNVKRIMTKMQHHGRVKGITDSQNLVNSLQFSHLFFEVSNILFVFIFTR
jgi:hypothetical protein